MKSTTESDQRVLLDRARAGDDDALENLLQLVQPQLYRFSMKMCRHTEDAEDVLQDSMITLARSFRNFRGASSLSTWLYTIARSHCIKKRRTGKFAPKVEESLEGLSPRERGALVEPGPDPHAQAESLEVWKRVQAGIRALDPLYREVLVLRDVEGLKAKEVAEVVGITVAAVKSRLHRARAELRNQLTSQPYSPRPGCPDIRHIFSKHLEGELSPEICSTMEEHVENCEQCRAECDGLKASLNACSTAPCEVPLEIQERVREAIRSALQGLPS